MARARKKKVVNAASAEAFQNAGKTVIPIPLEEEASQSYLEYSYSVIYDRALPDARDGLKPVHRRILYGMQQMGLRPDHGYMKCARVVGDVMGKFHPHGDSAIYEAMVRLAQDFSLNTPLVDGHGNFGSPNDGPAASRYTEARMDAMAMFMVGELNENTVNMMPNYDGSLEEPVVLPAAFPNLLVNGAEGIAVGMATKMIPHNLNEAVDAARLLLSKPKSTLDDLMTLIPGPDLPTGGSLVGMDGVREAYETGKGTVRLRAKAEISPLEGSRGRFAITVSELPYAVGTEKVVEKIKTEISNKRIQGISDIIDLTDGNGIRLVIECKTGVNAESLLNDLYRLTPMETSFGISNLALVDGAVKTLGLKQLLEVFIAHRLDVVTRRTRFRLDKAEARKHIVEGMLIALDNVDAVVKIIRGSKDSQAARDALMKKFKLTDIQTGVILDMPLRRLVALEVETLRKELSELEKTIAALVKILGSDRELKKLVDAELANINSQNPSPRKTVLVDGNLADHLISAPSSGQSSASITIPDVPVSFIYTSSGVIAPLADVTGGKGKKADGVIGRIESTSRAQLFAITTQGRAHRFNVSDVNSRTAVKDLVHLVGSERVLAVVPATGVGVALGTANGFVKICKPDFPSRGDVFDVIKLDSGDSVINASHVDSVEGMFACFVTSAGNLAVFSLDKVRPQGRAGAGMAGVKLPEGVNVVGFAVAPSGATLVTSTGATVKMTPLSEYTPKGRGVAGVKCHKFGKGEDSLAAAWVTVNPVGKDASGATIDLPAGFAKRDGAGVAVTPPAVVAETF
jgi:DNA gyrase subunit A